ncbi:MAG: gliding motility protein GldN [Bacteroidetes bacterium]|nr:gliding motility protein GldN [Bacteroidota bacterium]
MKKIILIVLLVFNVGITIEAFSQVFDSPPRDGAWDKTHSKDRKVVPYAPVREADVSWYTKIWREISFKEKMNQVFYYPDRSIRDRVSFMQMLMDAIKEGSITVYDNDEFTKPLSFEDMNAQFERTDTIQVEDVDNPGVFNAKEVKRKIDITDIKTIRLKEVQFFDKQRSVMDVRILGICPLLQDRDEKGELKPAYMPMFWIYFPDARPVFAKTELYNPKNGAERRTFDDIFQKRYFSSFIIKEDNTYDRKISEFKTGLDALLEAERIKEYIFDLEHNLWEF